MNIRHSSTGKKIIENNIFQDPQESKASNLNFDFLPKPETNHSQDLAQIRERLRQTDLSFPTDPKFSFHKSRDTFSTVFPSRHSSIQGRRSSYFTEQETVQATKHFNHRVDSISFHRDAMIRASSLFKVFISK
jgi:hypothetical protein